MSAGTRKKIVDFQKLVTANVFFVFIFSMMMKKKNFCDLALEKNILKKNQIKNS